VRGVPPTGGGGGGGQCGNHETLLMDLTFTRARKERNSEESEGRPSRDCFKSRSELRCSRTVRFQNREDELVLIRKRM